MIKKCLGCGVELQDNNILLEGYTNTLENDFCMRCFKMKNYGEYEFIMRDNEQYKTILRQIGKTKGLILFVVDIVLIPKNIKEILSYFKTNKIILVLNKKDTMPFDISDEKYISYFDKDELKLEDIIVVSSKNGYNIDNLMNLINKHRTPNVYFVGNTNAGKSSLINNIVDNYSISSSTITISPMPSTTLSDIKIKMKNFNIIDTPGLVDDGNILNYLEIEDIKKVSIRKEIKPKTYQIKKNESLLIDKYIRIDYLAESDNSFTLFMSNDLEVKRIRSKRNEKLKEMPVREINFGFKEDVVINGLGFIKTMYEGNIKVYCNKDVEIYTRKSLI